MTTKIEVASHIGPIRVRASGAEIIKVRAPSAPVSIKVLGQPGPEGRPGEQGPPGPPGPAGAGYTYQQVSEANVWVISHNLGVKPSVSVFTPGGLMMMAEVQHLSENTLEIRFLTPKAGFARLN